MQLKTFSFSGAHILIIDLCLWKRGNRKWWDKVFNKLTNFHFKRNTWYFSHNFYLILWTGDGKFFTMLDAYWWALITMTTVSYLRIYTSFRFENILWKQKEKGNTHVWKPFWYEKCNQFEATWWHSSAVQVNQNILKLKLIAKELITKLCNFCTLHLYLPIGCQKLKPTIKQKNLKA